MSERFFCHALGFEIPRDDSPSLEICMKTCNKTCEVSGFIVCDKHGRVPAVQSQDGELVCPGCVFEEITGKEVTA